MFLGKFFKSILESLRRRARMMTDAFNSYRNVVCNFTEGTMYSFPKYACRQEQLRHRKEPAKHQMFSTASSFWKQLEFPLFQDLVLVRRKGKGFMQLLELALSHNLYTHQNMQSR